MPDRNLTSKNGQCLFERQVIDTVISGKEILQKKLSLSKTGGGILDSSDPPDNW
jgi:hypothetical protein